MHAIKFDGIFAASKTIEPAATDKRHYTMKSLDNLQKEIGGRIVSSFAYEVDPDRRFKQIVLEETPTLDQVRIALNYGYKFTADILWKKNVDGNMSKHLVYASIPVDGKSYEYED